MGQAASPDRKLLSSLIPLNAISPENLERLAPQLSIEQVSAGHALFRRGDQDRQAVYVIAGEVSLTDADGQTASVQAGTSQARYPLAHRTPREVTAVARTPVRCLRVDRETLDNYVTWDQSASYAASELDGDQGGDWGDDWMTRMLQSVVFQRVPPANLQAMFMRMEPVSVQAGEVIVTQGEPGEYYYVVRTGRFAVKRSTEGGSEVRLAELSEGASFGEEALIADVTRNATVTAVTDGTLMRLSKADFGQLLKEPVMRTVERADADAMVREGKATWLDVRTEAEVEQQALSGAVNVPLYLLRVKARQLPRDRTYIVYCDTGKRSQAAAFLLNERGYDVHVLAGGLEGAP